MWQSYFFFTTLALAISFFVLQHPQAFKINLVTDSLARRRLVYEQCPMLRRLLNGNQPYQAPLHLCDLEPRVPDSYTIFLHFGYDLETRRNAIGNGVDWNVAILSVHAENERHGLFYSAELDEEGLKAVRANIGVDMVECDLEAEPIGARVD